MKLSATIRVKDLQHMMAVIGFTKIAGTEITKLENPAQYENENHNALQHKTSNQEKTQMPEKPIEIIIMSLSVIYHSTHRLFIQTNEQYYYEYRNIYMSQEWIVVLDKRYQEDNVTFTLFPYITLAIGAVSGIGEGRANSLDKNEIENKNNIITVTEQTPTTNETYKTICEIDQEPEAIERISKFLAYSHQACLKGVVDYD